MFALGLPLALRGASHLAQSFSRYRVARAIWQSHHQCRAISRKAKQESDRLDGKKPQPKRTMRMPKITLVSPDNTITVTVLEEAQRLAKHRGLNLVKVSDFDSTTQRPIYKMMSNTSILEEAEETEEEDTKEEDTKTDQTAQKSSRGVKLFYVSAKIAEHDLLTKTRHVVKLLSKGQKVKVVITLDGADGDQTQKVIEAAVRNDGSVKRMPSKKNVILLLIEPLDKNEDVSVDNKDKTAS